MGHQGFVDGLEDARADALVDQEGSVKNMLCNYVLGSPTSRCKFSESMCHMELIRCEPLRSFATLREQNHPISGGSSPTPAGFVSGVVGVPVAETGGAPWSWMAWRRARSLIARRSSARI